MKTCNTIFFTNAFKILYVPLISLSVLNIFMFRWEALLDSFCGSPAHTIFKFCYHHAKIYITHFVEVLHILSLNFIMTMLNLQNSFVEVLHILSLNFVITMLNLQNSFVEVLHILSLNFVITMLNLQNSFVEVLHILSLYFVITMLNLHMHSYIIHFSF